MIKSLLFSCSDLSESGLFNGLQLIQIKKIFPACFSKLPGHPTNQPPHALAPPPRFSDNLETIARVWINTKILFQKIGPSDREGGLSQPARCGPHAPQTCRRAVEAGLCARGAAGSPGLMRCFQTTRLDRWKKTCSALVDLFGLIDEPCFCLRFPRGIVL